MNASDKAHLREAARRGECTPEFAEQVIREVEEMERNAEFLANWIGAPYTGQKQPQTNGTDRA